MLRFRKTNFCVIEIKNAPFSPIDGHVIITLQLISDGLVWSRNVSSTWEIIPLVNYREKGSKRKAGYRAHTLCTE